MGKRVLLIATVQSHIGQFHKPLMRLLKENGWEIHVAARDNLAEKNGLQLEYPDRVFNIPFQRSPFDRRNIKAYLELKKILAAYHYDIIHCNTPVGGWLGRSAARRIRNQGTQVFYTAHGFHFYKGAPRINWLIYYPIEKWMSRFTDKLITISAEDYEIARQKFYCPVYHIHGVGADSTKYHPIGKENQQKQKADLGLDGHIIVNVGELLPNKNQKTAILAMKQILETVPDAKLLIAGNGPEKERLEQLVAEYKLEQSVIFTGYTTQLEMYLQVCDVMVACSYREGIPLNVIEAMLCGKPVVANDNRGHRELVKDGKNGFLVNANNAEEYAKMVIKVLQSSADYFNVNDIMNSIGNYKDVNVVPELKTIYGLANEIRHIE